MEWKGCKEMLSRKLMKRARMGHKGQIAVGQRKQGKRQGHFAGWEVCQGVGAKGGRGWARVEGGLTLV
jgi:hypothetical protein